MRRKVPGQWLPWSLAGLAIAAQIIWPLTTGTARVSNTQAVVALFAATSISHAWVHRGASWAARYALAAIGFGFGIEVLGVATGFPFSAYNYTEILTPQLLGVPLVVPLAWAMMAYPALLVGRRLANSRWTQILIGTYALAVWDLFLDPQMVGEGYWRWEHPIPALPGVPGIPLVNYLGWLLASALLMILLSYLPDHPADEAVPALLYGWTWIGGIVANAVFLDRPAVALWGGIAMSVVALPYLRQVLVATKARHASAQGQPRGATI